MKNARCSVYEKWLELSMKKPTVGTPVGEVESKDREAANVGKNRGCWVRHRQRPCRLRRKSPGLAPNTGHQPVRFRRCTRRQPAIAGPRACPRESRQSSI